MARIITNFMRAWANSCELVNGTEGISDIEGKAATGSGERAGMRASFKLVSRVCENCGEKIFEDSPKGLCPACVLETGLRPLADETVARVGLSAVAVYSAEAAAKAGSAKADDHGHPAHVAIDFGDYELLE